MARYFVHRNINFAVQQINQFLPLTLTQRLGFGYAPVNPEFILKALRTP
jgi:hypothetical protein